MKKISPRRTRVYTATTLAIVLVAAACGGEQNADPPATSAAVPNTTPSTILPPATSHPTTTAPAPTTTTSVPTPSTTTELSEEEQAKQAVIEAAENAWHLFNEAKLDPTNHDKFEAALAAHSGSARTGVEQVLTDYRASNRRSVSSTSQPASIAVDPASVTLNGAHDVASLEFCRVGSNVLVLTGGNPDGTDRVLDDSINAYKERETYVLEAGVWLNSEVELLSKYENSSRCEPVN